MSNGGLGKKMYLKTYTKTVYGLLMQWTLAVFLIILLILPASHHVAAIKWLALSKGKARFWNQTRDCITSRKDDGLVKQQVRICKQNLELMAVVSHASKEASHVCQEVFKHRRWNCSSVNMAPNYLADLTGGSREQAFVTALSSASLTRAISKACSIGATAKCSCGRLPNEPAPGEFKWGGCGDDVYFGLAFSKLFADAQYSGKKRSLSKKSKVNLHNTAVGRNLCLQIVSDSLATACKCHGVSGSCSIKTCWKALPDLKQMAEIIQKKYAVAVEVESKKVNTVRKLLPVFSLYDKRRDYSRDDLIYYTKSPDYCLPDTSLGSLGTVHRECQKNNRDSSGCRSMCCGRGFTSQVVEVKKRCDCKYYWCCYVKCKTCIHKVEINRCR